MNNKSLKVVFIDDDDRFLDRCRERFSDSAPTGSVEIEKNDRDETRRAVRALDEMRKEMRKQKKVVKLRGAELFDDADIVFVDYDLLTLEETTALTGEDIAYLLRCFATCGIVVLLNPPDLGTNFFDLRLRRPFESWADVVLGADQLENSWLWAKKPSGFAPWLWPNLPDAVSRRRKQIKEAEGALDKSVLDLVGIPAEARIAMDHIMGEPVAASARDQFYSLRDFVIDSNYCVHRKDRKDAKEAFEQDDQRVAHIGASRLSMWLEHVVLPTQSVLIDAPHLVSRLPGLLAGPLKNRTTWNRVCRRDHESLKDVLNERPLNAFRMKKQHWLSRPAWFWPLIAGAASYSELAAVDEVPFVFCEDTSVFVDRDDAHRFVADVPAPAGFRFVEKPKSTKGIKQPDYRPSVRLSM
jgi:hypothetical protein